LKPEAIVADRQPLMRAGLRGGLEAAGVVCADECATVGQLVAAVRRTRPRLALVDLTLPGDVLGAIHHLTYDRDDIDVIAIADCDAGGELGAVRAGATGVVYRDTALEQLPHALAAVLAGESAIPRRLLPALLAELRIPRPRLASSREQVRLTEREREVLDRLADGLSTRDIAALLFVAPVTVRTHVCALLRKLGLTDRDALIEWARQARETRVPA
jgi:DNA-binding NarL/FixJ family response regulator